MEKILVPTAPDKEIKALYKAYLQMLFTAFSWALSTILIKLYIGSVPPFHLLMGRALIGAAVISAAFPQKVKAITKGDIKAGLVLGLFIFLAYAAAIIGLKYTTASKAGFLIALPVLFIPLIQIALKKKLPSKWIVLSVVSSIAGLKLISGMNGTGFNAGDALSIACALFYSVYILQLDRLGKNKDEIVLTVLQLAVIAITALLAALFFEGFNPGYFRAGLLPIIIIGIIGTGLPTLFQTQAQKVASPESIGILQLAEPLFTLLLAYLILHETILPVGLVGSALILCSLVLAVVKKV
ncbi:DMT family transporter [Zhaonella formicivorans]|uniref:DMT family transporter n=1 Tax=Zhaonella formicivorans TaxID=2528593 RepID=UPI0010E530C2|nr:DMT family transporter [Zhaonella formicivorans]